MDFLFHEVSEKEKQEIKKQAREILDNFSKKLSESGDRIRGVGDFFHNGGVFLREESEEKCEIDKKVMFDNAPQKNKDFIIAEKGGW